MTLIQTPTLTMWRVPDCMTMPDEDMIEWLQTCPHEWSGDEEGIVIDLVGGGDPALARPGDWVGCSRGLWFVLSASDQQFMHTQLENN